MDSKNFTNYSFSEQHRGDALSLMLLLLLIGFWLRVSFLLALVYHIDEFITMFAAQMVAEQGLPIFPSGLFYDSGLLQSFLSGLFIALLNFREEIVRWPTLLVGVLTIAVYYSVGRSLFSSRTTGLLAAALITFDTLAIEWSGRARMYMLAHLFVLLSLAWLLKGNFQTPSERNRYFFLIFLVAALLSHTITFTILLPLAMLTLIFTLFYSRRWLHQPRLWLQAIVGLLLLAGVMLIVRLGQTSTIISPQSEAATRAPFAKLGFLGGFFTPSLTWSGFDDLTFFFFDYPYNWLLVLIALGMLTVVFRFKQKQATFADWVFCFLALYIVLVIFEMGSLLTLTWQKTRYLFFLNLPAFFLLTADSLNRLLDLLAQWLPRIVPKVSHARWKNASLIWAGLLLIVMLMASSAYDTTTVQSTGNYDTAFKFVRDQWQDGDKVMTVHPTAAYLYLGRNDYYANQVTAKVLSDDEDGGDLVGRWTGAPLIDSVEKLNAALAREKRLWFVIDIKRLYRRYDYFVTQEIFSQMNHVRQFGEVYVFVSESFPRPLPATPDVFLEAQFDQMVWLEGYSLNLQTLAPDGSLPLYLYWRPLELPSRPYKVFVQLRNGQGENIAQADHYFYENLLTGREWLELQKNREWLRETALLHLPPSMPSEQGPYHLYLGIYDPDSFERVLLINDTSGENAVVLPFPSWP